MVPQSPPPPVRTPTIDFFRNGAIFKIHSGYGNPVRTLRVNLTNDCHGNQLNYNNDLSTIGNNNYALQKLFETDFLTVIGNAKLRPSFVICWVAQGSRPRCGPRHPIWHYFAHIFLCKIICNNYFIVEFIITFALIFTWSVGSIY